MNMTSVIGRNITEIEIFDSTRNVQQVDPAEGSWNNDTYPIYVPKKKTYGRQSTGDGSRKTTTTIPRGVMGQG
jgi:hypothetical protein